MTERKRKYIHRDAMHFNLDTSSVTWHDGYLEFKIREYTSPIPSKVQGIVRVYPHYFNTKKYFLGNNGKHLWWPISPYSRIEVVMQNPKIQWTGAGYFDFNYGEEPLENGFKSWNWSCAKISKSERIIRYNTKNRDGSDTNIGISFSTKGEISNLTDKTIQTLPNTKMWKIPREACIEDNQKPRVLKTLEDTPFYSRTVLTSQYQKQSIMTMHESLDLNRFKAPWTQLMLPFKMPRTIF